MLRQLSCESTLGFTWPQRLSCSTQINTQGHMNLMICALEECGNKELLLPCSALACSSIVKITLIAIRASARLGAGTCIGNSKIQPHQYHYKGSPQSPTNLHSCTKLSNSGRWAITSPSTTTHGKGRRWHPPTGNFRRKTMSSLCQVWR